MNGRDLSQLYRTAHNRMRDVDGLLPQEAFDELLKFMLYKEFMETDEQVGQGAAKLRVKSASSDPTEIRRLFSSKLKEDAPWALHLWRDGSFQLSDRLLVDLDQLFSPVHFTSLPLDIRSTALRTFLTPDIRRGLGIYLTPEDVVKMMVDVIKPKPKDVILDPACGSGTFLIEAVKSMSARRGKSSISIFGLDKNPRMMLLAVLNLGHERIATFHRACTDSLRMLAGNGLDSPLAIEPNSIDVILTNPPFGVTVTRDTGTLDHYATSNLPDGNDQDRVPSEILFIELCLRLLKPGGRLGIVLPRSVITNNRLAPMRRVLDELGYLTHLVDLPPETFSATGTQTTTVVAFFKKHSAKRRASKTTVQVCHVSNVGYDSTGRKRDENELPMLAGRFIECENELAKPEIIVHSGVSSTESMACAADLLFQRSATNSGIKLNDFVELAGTGRTPPRSAYTDDGMFILKVGNLSGRGIDWEPRDRNFVATKEAEKRRKAGTLILRQGDVLLTSSAHSPKYIAKKVDVVGQVPPRYKEVGVTFVGELIRVRPKKGVDPYVLLAVLRHPSVRDNLQGLVRGQTAHLNPGDLLGVVIPCDLRTPTEDILRIASMMKKETKLAFELNSLSLDANRQLALV